MRNLKGKYIFTLCSLLLFIGCTQSDVDDNINHNLSDTQNEIALNIVDQSISQVGVVSRSSEEVSKEKMINRGYIFVFEADGTLKGYQKIGSGDVDKNNSQYPTIKTTVAGYDPTKDKIIAVFNYCEKSFLGEDFTALTKENISDYFPLDKEYLKLLQQDFVSNTYALGMPMFVNDFDDNDDNSVHEIYRALARIEIYVKETGVSTGLLGHSHSFTPDNVRFTLLNGAENGQIGFNSRQEVKGETGGTPHQPADVLTYDKRPSEYETLRGVLDAKPSSNTIYLYEFPYSTQVITGDNVAKDSYDPRRLSILIEHEDPAAHPDKVFYYKLQLVDKTKNEYYDIKRNHDYRVVITNVYSDGYTDPEEAYIMPPSNIEYEIYDDEGDLTFSNGQYAIGMDEVLNYESVTIYGPETTVISFDNIRRILPKDVTDPLTDAELAQMTNIVDFEVLKSADIDNNKLTVIPHSDFASDPRLTDEGRSIKLEISGEGTCKIKLKIKLGNLELGFDEIAIQKVGGAFGGDSSFDAHPSQLPIKNQNIIAGTWNSVHKDFGARNDGDDMIVYMGENATPVGYKSLNGYISSGAAANAYPYFEPKTREGYFSYYDLETDPDRETVKKAKIVLNQLAPFYVGHFGNKAKSGPHYYDALIVEKIEEIKDTHSTPNKETGGLKNWSEQLGHIYYDENKIFGNYLGLEKYLNFAQGQDIAEYIVNNNQTVGALPIAARYCYMKNDINGDGIIQSDEPIVWYLPAANQMLAIWVSKYLIDSEVDAQYYGFHLEHDNTPYYWTCSEVAPTQWDKRFDNNVIQFNMLEGEMSTGGRKGMNGYTDLAHIRCVRNIVYDNSK